MDKKFLDPLKEVATIASDNAATTLAKLIGKKVQVTTPIIRLVAVEKVTTQVGDIDRISSVVAVKIKGDLSGLLVFLIDPDDASRIASDAVKHLTSGDAHHNEQVVLREMVNIIAGTALNSINKLLNLQTVQSVPASTTDMLGAVLDPFIAEFGTTFDQVLIQQEVFSIPASKASLKFLAIIDPPSTSRMLEKISNKVA